MDKSIQFNAFKKLDWQILCRIFLLR